MQITSFSFFLFLIAVLALYYLAPRRFQWGVLLLASLVFSLSQGAKQLIFLGFTALSVYAGARRIQALSDAEKEKLAKTSFSAEEKKGYKQAGKRRRKRVMLLVLLSNLLLLLVFKYLGFFMDQVNLVAGLLTGSPVLGRVSILAPLGISFYTFQMIGYLVSVYWGNIRAERSFFRLLLFCSFFPQITQGPISEFSDLSGQLFAEHSLKEADFFPGAERLLWGFFKKMVVADALVPCVQDVFANYAQYAAPTVLIGAFLYSVQIYADFSGYMDIMCGLCRMMGIRLTENFARPYFSKSIAEYWRRWHISLGAWFKRYVYYPVGISRWNRNLGKWAKRRFGQRLGDTIPATVALTVVWLATGLWHGASWAYIIWGLVNGLFIILSLWLEPIYAKGRSVFHVQEHPKIWRLFQVLRTFFLVTLIKVLPEVGSLRDGFGLVGRIFSGPMLVHSLQGLLPFVEWGVLTRILFFLAACLGTLCMLLHSLAQARGWHARSSGRRARFLRVLRCCILAFLILTFGVQNSWGGGGFLYAQF